MSNFILAPIKHHPITNKVSAIKALRNLSGLGLKEAKDAVEEVMAGRTITLERNGFSEMADDCVRTLGHEGLAVNFPTEAALRISIMLPLRELAAIAMHERQYDLARDIISILEKHDQ